jgi:hypothetical protein
MNTRSKTQEAQKAVLEAQDEAWHFAADALASADELWYAVRERGFTSEKRDELIRLYERVEALCNNATALSVEVKLIMEEAQMTLKEIRSRPLD